MSVVLNILSQFDDKGVAKAQRRIADLGSSAKGFKDSVAADMVKAGASVERFGDKLATTGDRMTMRMTLPIVAGFGLATKAASDLEESVNKSAVVFGDQAGQIAAFAEAAASTLGQSKQQALEATASFGNLFQTMGVGGDAAADMSMDLTTLASDLASFHNIAPEEALEKLRSGLVGEAEPMRQLGVLLSENEVKQKAYAMGLAETGDELTEQQKVQARYALIMEQTATAQGDFARTSDGLANQTRIAKAELTDAAASLGTHLIPMATTAAGMLASLAQKFGDLGPGTQKLIIGVGLAAAAMGPLMSVGGRFVSLGGKMLKTAGNIGLAFGKNAKYAPTYARAVAGATRAVGSFITSLARQGAALVVSSAKWVANTAALVASKTAQLAAAAASKVMAAGQWLLNAALTANPIGLVVAAIAGLVAAFVIAYKKSDTFRRIVDAAFQGIKRVAVAVFGFLATYIKAWVTTVRTVLSGLTAVAKWVVDRFTSIKDGAVKAFRAVVDWARGVPGRIKDAVGNLGKTLYNVGGDLLRGLWEGMQSIAGWLKSKITSFFSDLLPGWAKKALGIESPSKVFANIGLMSGAGLVEGLDASRAMVAAASARLAGAAALALGGPSLGVAYAGTGTAAGGTVVNVGGIHVSVDGSGLSGPQLVTAVRSGVEPALERLAREIRAL